MLIVFARFKFVFCSKKMNIIQKKNKQIFFFFFDVTPLNNADSFFLQDNTINHQIQLCIVSLLLKSLKE